MMMRFLPAGFLLAVFMLAFGTTGFSQSQTKGFASTYPLALDGSVTASGELYIPTELTACHATLPFNTLVKVTNLKNNKSVTVRVNDRFTYRNSRVIDISKSASDIINLFGDITPQVSIQVIGMADATMLADVKTKQATALAAKTNTLLASANTNAAPVAQTTVATTQAATITNKVTTPAASAPAAAAQASVATPDDKSNDGLLSNLKITIPTVTLQDISNLAINYISMSFFRR